MKVVVIREAKAGLSACIDDAQTERTITRHGRPAALVLGVEGQELEDVLLGMDDAFWKDLEERRRRTATVSEAEARRILGVRARTSRRSPGARRRAPSASGRR